MLDYLPEVLKPYLEERSFSLLGPPSERHGSWEWTFHKHAGLDRFIVVALTSAPVPLGERAAYSVEVFAGAENGSRFVRHLVGQTRLIDEGEVTERVCAWLHDILGTAVELSEALKPTDLAEAYLPPRSPR